MYLDFFILLLFYQRYRIQRYWVHDMVCGLEITLTGLVIFGVFVYQEFDDDEGLLWKVLNLIYQNLVVQLETSVICCVLNTQSVSRTPANANINSKTYFEFDTNGKINQICHI